MAVCGKCNVQYPDSGKCPTCPAPVPQKSVWECPKCQTSFASNPDQIEGPKYCPTVGCGERMRHLWKDTAPASLVPGEPIAPARAQIHSDPDLTIAVGPAAAPAAAPAAENIHTHEGRKYLRQIFSAEDPTQSVWVDIYEVIVAWAVNCPGRQQALNKLLAAGQRGKGSQLDDLVGARAALNRAIDLQRREEIQ